VVVVEEVVVKMQTEKSELIVDEKSGRHYFSF
jgi:hypothetical protein